MKTRSRWTASNIPSQNGRLAVVTGTGGLGYEVALVLAQAGAEIILAGRNRAKGEASAQKIRTSLPVANIRVEDLDLADLASVEAFASRMHDRNQALDILINNAAVMMVPRRQVTKNGFELQFGTNHLGHFALTAQLMPLLRKADGARVVSVCALAANGAEIDFADLQRERQYGPMTAYGQSKLANLMFSLELHRRSSAGYWGVQSIAAHPGLSRTDLSGTRGENRDSGENTMPLPLRLLAPLLLQPAGRGALPVLFAATATDAESGSYYGPDGQGERKGFPAPAKIPPTAENEALAGQLWSISEQLTHIRFEQ